MPQYKDLVVEQPDGEIVCRAHGLIICGLCCVDFSFLQSDDGNDSIEDEDSAYEEQWIPNTPQSAHIHNGASGRAGVNGFATNCPEVAGVVSGVRLMEVDLAEGERPDRLSIRRGTGRSFPTTFVPPLATSVPSALFRPAVSRRAIPPVTRYIRRDDPQQMLIYADGACLNNGQANPKAGWAFVFKPTVGQTPGHVSARLENIGPFGDPSNQTSNRAELRAVLAALRFRHWEGEGFKTIVFATDSEYVAEGATHWARTWVRNGWRTSTGAVRNKDLWEMLLGEVERWNSWGVEIQFWRIPRALNERADTAAKQAAEGTETYDTYQEFSGILV
ncbi:Ribonuclease H domain protein [Metarhizium robertsii ARSEF 23]|uniref:ribonuclease H n=1 Tax=Metarhizium robertsii (strain ARSEF 23 / ATCC MYA-3075) TaxID=655844 RepID=E9EJ35_METRA|nr:Ribonuclease H domain protein [Metarhizium robertsii ARSEF 23]EFZ03312.1 Ribonuclease H domain protein [Metarhizium robertsii ARSEF 23]